MVTGTTYDPANRLLWISGNALTESREYNTMGQLTQIISSASGGSSLNITYNYSSTQNNGKITSQTDNISGEQVVYAYDALNRLASAAATSGFWGQGYAYDGFGNLTDQTVTASSGGTTVPTLSVVYNASNNLQTTDCADANGNILAQSVAPWNCSNTPNGTEYTYDMENRMHPPSLYGVGSFYSYAPGNKRVWRGNVNSSGTTTLDEVTFWSVTGKKLATYNLIQTANASSTVLYANVATTSAYFGGRLIANSTGNVVTDRLGSVGKYYPWGQVKPSGNVVGTEGFTGYFRDAETGLDYADQRFHQPGMGRFMSPDPYQNSAGPKDPSSWNRYAYVGGDPVNRTDPTGLEFVAEGGCDSESEDPADCEDNGGTIQQGGGTGGNFSNSDITGYDADGNPIIGDPNQTNDNATVTSSDSYDWLSGFYAQLGLFLQNQFQGKYPISLGSGTPPSNFNAPSNSQSWYKIPLVPGTNYCGPGGNGWVLTSVDQACAQHDACYNNAGASFLNNVTGTGNQGAIAACNKQLCKTLTIAPKTKQENGQAFFVGGAFGCIP